MLDPHVHLRDWNQSAKETLNHGLTAASKAGICHVFDMPNTDPPLTGPDNLLRRLEDINLAEEQVRRESGRSIVCSVYGGVTANPAQIRTMVGLCRQLFPKVIGLKLFAGHSTGGMGVIGRDLQLRIYRTLAESGYRGVLAVHCEKEELLDPSRFIPGIPHSHSRARPPEAEIESIRDQLELARLAGFDGTLHICHISTLAGLELIEREREGLACTVTCGATPHHMLLDTTFLPDRSLLLKVNPPLREAAERAAMLQALAAGRIDWIESDHAPHTADEKAAGASGIPGFAGYLLLKRALLLLGVSARRIAALTGGRAAEVFALGSDSVKIPRAMEHPNVEPGGGTADPDHLAGLAADISRDYPACPWRLFIDDLGRYPDNGKN